MGIAGRKLIPILLVVLLFASTVWAGGMKLAWDPSGAFTPTGYRAYYGVTPRTGTNPALCLMCGYSNKQDMGMTNPFQISGLLPNKIYYFSTTAFDATRETAFSAEVQNQSDATGAISFQWSPIVLNTLAGYKIYYGTAARTGNDPKTCTMCGYTKKDTFGLGPTMTWTVSDLITGAQYWFSATAYDSADNESAFSNEVNGVAVEFPPPAKAPSDPKNMRIVAP